MTSTLMGYSHLCFLNSTYMYFEGLKFSELCEFRSICEIILVGVTYWAACIYEIISTKFQVFTKKFDLRNNYCIVTRLWFSVSHWWNCPCSDWGRIAPAVVVVCLRLWSLIFPCHSWCFNQHLRVIRDFFIMQDWLILGILTWEIWQCLSFLSFYRIWST